MGLVDVLEFEASGSADDLGLVDNWRYVEDLGLVEMEGLTPTPPPHDPDPFRASPQSSDIAA